MLRLRIVSSRWVWLAIVLQQQLTIFTSTSPSPPLFDKQHISFEELEEVVSYTNNIVFLLVEESGFSLSAMFDSDALSSLSSSSIFLISFFSFCALFR